MCVMCKGYPEITGICAKRASRKSSRASGMAVPKIVPGIRDGGVKLLRLNNISSRGYNLSRPGSVPGRIFKPQFSAGYASLNFIP